MFKVNESSREIFIYDDIGPAWLGMIDSGSVIDALESLGDAEPINLRVNSPGGDVTEGLAIFNAIQRHQGTVNTYADSLAASCGSYIFCAGNGDRVVAQNAILMIHDPWGMSIGNAAEHRKTADIYDKFADSMARDYASAADISAESARTIMLDETWYNAEEAVDAGFATSVGASVIEDPEVIEGRFAKTPQRLVAKAQPGTRGGRTAKMLRLRNGKSLTSSKPGV